MHWIQEGGLYTALTDEALDYLLPSISDGIAGAVYTQTTDVEAEVNGIMTYDREVVKVNEEAIREINLKMQ